MLIRLEHPYPAGTCQLGAPLTCLQAPVHSVLGIIPLCCGCEMQGALGQPPQIAVLVCQVKWPCHPPCHQSLLRVSKPQCSCTLGASGGAAAPAARACALATHWQAPGPAERAAIAAGRHCTAGEMRSNKPTICCSRSKAYPRAWLPTDNAERLQACPQMRSRRQRLEVTAAHSGTAYAQARVQSKAVWLPAACAHPHTCPAAAPQQQPFNHKQQQQQ